MCNHAINPNVLILLLILIITNFYIFAATDSPSVCLPQLSAAALTYLNLGVSESTRKAYQSGFQKYITFCRETNHRPALVCEDTLLFFATYLAQERLSYPTIQVYLSAVRQSSHSWQTITHSNSMIRLCTERHTLLKGHYLSIQGKITNYLSNYDTSSHCIFKAPWKLQRCYDIIYGPPVALPTLDFLESVNL